MAREIGRVSDGMGGTRHDGLLRKPIYPANSVGRIVGENPGIVEMPVGSRAEAEYINDFLMKGLEAGCPERIEDLRAHFVKRLDAAQTELEAQCASAAIQSCDEYVAHQTEVLEVKVKRYEALKQKGQPYSFGGVSTLLFTQLNIDRPDRTAQNQAGQMDALTQNLNRLTEIQIRQAENAAGAPVQPSAAEMQRIAELEEEIAQLKHERDIEKAIQLEEVSKPKTETVQCWATTGSGERCSKPALANGYCNHPAHQKLAENNSETGE